MEGCVRVEAYICPHITDALVMRRLVKQEATEFIIPCDIKKWILLVYLRHYFLEFLMMHKTEIPLVNVANGVQMEGIKLRTTFSRMGLFRRASGELKGERFLVLE